MSCAHPFFNSSRRRLRPPWRPTAAGLSLEGVETAGEARVLRGLGDGRHGVPDGPGVVEGEGDVELVLVRDLADERVDLVFGRRRCRRIVPATREGRRGARRTIRERTRAARIAFSM